MGNAKKSGETNIKIELIKKVNNLRFLYKIKVYKTMYGSVEKGTEQRWQILTLTQGSMERKYGPEIGKIGEFLVFQYFLALMKLQTLYLYPVVIFSFVSKNWILIPNNIAYLKKIKLNLIKPQTKIIKPQKAFLKIIWI